MNIRQKTATLILASLTIGTAALAPTTAYAGTATENWVTKPSSTSDTVLYADRSSIVDGCTVHTSASWIRATNAAHIVTQVSNPYWFGGCRVGVSLRYNLLGTSIQDGTVHEIVACGVLDPTCTATPSMTWNEASPAMALPQLLSFVETLGIDHTELPGS